MATLAAPARPWTVTAAAATIVAAGTVAATNKLILVAMPAAWHTAGISTLDYCCNGSAAGVKGDLVERWNASGDIVGNTPGNAHSWRVETLAGGLGQICVDRDDVFDGSGSIFWSEAVGFTGGTTTARPTASDEIEITSTTNILHTVNGTNVIHLWRCSDSGREGVRMAITNTGASAGPCALMSIERAASTPAAWTTKIAARYMGGSGTFGNRSDWTAVAPNGGWRARVSATARTPIAIGDTPPVANDVDGDRLIAPCGLNDATIGRLGFVDDFHFIDDAFTAYGTLSDVNGTLGWIALDEVVWPWNHATAMAGNTAGAKLLVNYLPVADSLLISATPAPGALGATFDAARWTPLVVVFTVPSGYPAKATAKVGADGLDLTVYDQGVFTPLFAQHSTFQTAGGTVTMSILPIGGWWAAPVLSVGLFKEAH